MAEIDRLLGIYGDPVKSWPEEPERWDRDMILPFARREVPASPTPPKEWNTTGDVMRTLDAQYGSGWQFAAPQIAVDVAEAAKAVGSSPVFGKPVVPSENPELTESMIGHAGSIVGPMAAMGFARAGLAKPGGLELGIFGGRLGAEALAAKGETRPLQALDMIETMEKQGKSREEIWNATAEHLKDTPYAGAFRGVDTKPRFEISDHADYVTGDGALYRPGKLRSEILDQGASPEALDKYGYTGRLDSVWEHPALFDAYPSMAETTWAAVPSSRMALPGYGGTWRGKNLGMEINADVAPALARGRSITAHEAQHGLQDIEGFARGSNPEVFKLPPAQLEGGSRQLLELGDAKMLRAKADAAGVTIPEVVQYVKDTWGLTPQGRAADIAAMHSAERIQELTTKLRDRLAAAQDPNGAYMRTAGEAEARAVQARMYLTPDQRRARFPWLDYDVPEGQQIVRFGDRGPQMSTSDGPPPLPPKSSLDDILADTRKKHEFADAVIRNAIATGNPKVVASRGGDLRSVMTKAPDHDGYRVTTFSENDPLGHRDYPNTPDGLKELRRDLVSQGLRPPQHVGVEDILNHYYSDKD